MNDRILVLDGFRAIAIVLTLLFHYFSYWEPPFNPGGLYPYGSSLKDFYLAGYGYLGVHFFFIISGFVISMTLANCRTISEFAVKRLARLWPAMLICSVLTYCAVHLLPARLFDRTTLDFLPSLTFIHPAILKRTLHINSSWMDGVYWSLFVEIIFYVWAALLFFSLRANFLPGFIVFLNAAVTIKALFTESVFVNVFLFPEFIEWFAAGIGFYYLFRNRKDYLAHLLVIESAVLIAGANLVAGDVLVLPMAAAFFVLFYAFLYGPKWVSFLSWKPIAMIGAASYSLYLIHHVIGVTLIVSIANALDLHGQESLAVAAVVSAAMIVFSLLIYRTWEVPARAFILGAFGKLSNKESVQRAVHTETSAKNRS